MTHMLPSQLYWLSVLLTATCLQKRGGLIFEAGYIIRGLQYSVTAVGYWYVHGLE